jgi:hypothetical protein
MRQSHFGWVHSSCSHGRSLARHRPDNLSCSTRCILIALIAVWSTINRGEARSGVPWRMIAVTYGIVPGSTVLCVWAAKVPRLDVKMIDTATASSNYSIVLNLAARRILHFLSDQWTLQSNVELGNHQQIRRLGCLSGISAISATRGSMTLTDERQCLIANDARSGIVCDAL